MNIKDLFCPNAADDERVIPPCKATETDWAVSYHAANCKSTYCIHVAISGLNSPHPKTTSVPPLARISLKSHLETSVKKHIITTLRMKHVGPGTYSLRTQHRSSRIPNPRERLRRCRGDAGRAYLIPRWTEGADLIGSQRRCRGSKRPCHKGKIRS